MKRALLLLGAPTLFPGVAMAGKRQLVVAPPRPLVTVPGALRVESRSNAQVSPELSSARRIELDGNTLTLAPRDVVLLPLSGVTRIITGDDDIARAFFQNNQPVLQALAPGSTTVEIYQAGNTPRVLTVVVSTSAAAIPAIKPTPEPTLAPTSKPTPEPTPEATPAPTPEPTAAPTAEPPLITPATSGLTVSLAQEPVAAPGTAGETRFVVSFANTGSSPARGVVVRLPLVSDVRVVPGSISNGGNFDAIQNEVVWHVGDLPARSRLVSGRVSVAPKNNAPVAFDAVATVEETGVASPITSAGVSYTFNPPVAPATNPPSVTNNPPSAALLTVFALPDRFLAGSGGARFGDVSASLSPTVDRLQQEGIVSGKATGQYDPLSPTKRAEYAVMTLKSLNLRDLRETTQIKFVLARPATVSLWVENAAGRRLVDLVRETRIGAGEHTALWNGRTPSGLASPGRYSYVCSVRDGDGRASRSATTFLRGTLTLVPADPLALDEKSSFVDVKSSDWFAPFLGVGEKQGILSGFPDKTFRPLQPITRVEAAAILVRALGLSDVASKWADKDAGFADYDSIPGWGRGSVNVATTIAKTATGQPIVRGLYNNLFGPLQPLRRDHAALLIARLIDRETTRRVSVSGAITPGAVVSINSKPISADGQGHFSFSFDLTTSTPTTLSVVETRPGV